MNGYNKYSPWSKIGNPKLRAVTFAAPMSMLDPEEIDGKNLDADKLMKEVSANSVNFVFSSDVVPWAYGHILYLNNAIRNTVPEKVRDEVPWAPKFGSNYFSKYCEVIDVHNHTSH